MSRCLGAFVVAGAVACALAACSAGTSEPTLPGPTLTPAPAASSAAPVTSDECPATPAPTPSVYPTSAADVDPQAPAPVIRIQPNGTIVSEGTWTKTPEGRQLRGYEETLELQLSDPRVSGTATFNWTEDDYEFRPGMDVRTYGGSMRIDGPDGDWVGTCRGSSWVYKEWATNCWLAGTKAYEGMSFVYNLIHLEPGDLLVRGHTYPGEIPE